MKVYQLSANWTDVSKMKDGDIAVIRQWPGVEDYNGRIVQRYRDTLVCLGEPSGQSWVPTIDKLKGKVEILKSGTLLEI
jgi:hypothetical protein